MTRWEAMKRGKPSGYSVRLSLGEGIVLYLADWDRKPDYHTTPCADCARWFGSVTEAASVARLADMLTGSKWIVVADPADSHKLTRQQEERMALEAAIVDLADEDAGKDFDLGLELSRTEWGTFVIGEVS